jgi:hypothetical protein
MQRNQIHACHIVKLRIKKEKLRIGGYFFDLDSRLRGNDG